MGKVLRVLGWLWAMPLTLVGLLHVFLFEAAGWYKQLGTFGDAMAWEVDQKNAPAWLVGTWHRATGLTVGNVVVLNANVDTQVGKLVLRHEQEHVAQQMKLGVTYPLFYFVIWLGIKLACPRSTARFSHPFAVEARRAAGQVVDVEGTIRRLVAQARMKDRH